MIFFRGPFSKTYCVFSGYMAAQLLGQLDSLRGNGACVGRARGTGMYTINDYINHVY